MKVIYYSFGADAEGEYEVKGRGGDDPRTLLQSLLPVPALRREGQISLHEAAMMAIGHQFDDGNFAVLTPPKKAVKAKAAGYIVTFLEDGSWSVEIDQEYIARREEVRKKTLFLKGVMTHEVGHCTLEIGDNETLVRLAPESYQGQIKHSVRVHTDGVIKTKTEYENKEYTDIVYHKFSYIIERRRDGEVAAAYLNNSNFQPEQFRLLLKGGQER